MFSFIYLPFLNVKNIILQKNLITESKTTNKGLYNELKERDYIWIHFFKTKLLDNACKIFVKTWIKNGILSFTFCHLQKKLHINIIWDCQLSLFYFLA